MGYGIDSIYDPSDVSRMLAELREQRIQMEDARRRKREGATKVGTSAWKMWSNEQIAQTKELLAPGDYKLNPEKNWLTRSFTPAKDRVVPTEEFAGRLKDFKDWESTGKIISDGKASMRLPSGEVIGSAPVPKDISAGPKGAGYFSKTGTKFGLKEAGAGIGAGMSLYETISSWDEHKKNKNIKRGVDVGKTLAYTASAVPGPHQAITAPIAGVLTLADLLWS